MKRLLIGLAGVLASAALATAGCSQAASPPAPTTAPAPKPAATAIPAEPTKAPASAQPTAAPAPKVSFPEKGKPITLIVPYTAGGSVDIAARVLAPALEKELGTPVQVVNRPEAGAQVGTTELARAKPDGYTLGYTVLPTTITLYLDPERKAVFSRKDFAPVAMHVIDPGVVGVKADSPYKTMQDFVNAAKAKPGAIKIAVTGVMGPSHLDVLQTQALTGAQFAVVHFDGGAPGLTAMLGGHVDAKYGNIGDFLPQMKSGNIRILGIMDTQENKFLPGVKTMESQGIKQYSAVSRGVSAPAGTPKEIVDAISGAIKKIIASNEHKAKMQEMGQTLRYMDPAEFGKYWDDVEAQVKPLMSLVKR